MYLPDSSLLTNITVQGHTRLGDILFEKKYITIRSLENRLYTDAELARLPDLPAEHPHYKEWQLRKRMLCRLCRYLAKRRGTTEILEIGCGNGWLAHHFAEIPGTLVTGLDINFTELQQAARVFSGDPNLCFVHGDIRSGILAGRRFDIIVFAASIEYFSSIKRIILTCLDYLNAGGEIHIVDTRFYRIGQVEWARKKTLAYYSSFGYPEMADNHFHFTLNDLKSFRHSILYDPDAVRYRLVKNKNLCHWIRVRNN